jgi:two-component system, chemotaxis family, chemotaxis protein CheY
VRKRLLIVDDSPVMRSFVRRSIEIAGLPVEEWIEAGHGREALDRLETRGVDLVLTDINMPVLDGEGLIRAMRADERLRDVPVVVVSTDGTELRMARLLELGALGYLRKPFAPERLCQLLEEVFPGWREWREEELSDVGF